MYWNNFVYIIPEIFLVSSSLIFLLLGIVLNKKVIHVFSLVSLLVTIGIVIINLDVEPKLIFDGLLKSSLYISIAKIIILFSSSSVLFMMLASGREYCYEFSIMILLAVFGLITLISANNLLSFYLSFEIQSVTLYALTCFDKNAIRSSESGIKYFVLSALSSCIMLYGISMLYGYTTQVDFYELYNFFSYSEYIPLGAVLGVVLVLISMFFKLSAAPFHMWVPDVYQGTSTVMTAFFSIVPKSTFVFLLIRILNEVLPSLSKDWQHIVICVSILSIFVSAFGAMRQNNLKRLFSYAAVGHMGYMLISLAMNTVASNIATIMYLLLYIVMNIGLFSILIQYRDDDCNLLNLKGLHNRSPVIAFCIAVIMLSMAGIPPLAGFYAKYDVLLSLVENGFIKVAIAFVIVSVISCYYYLRIIKVMYFDFSDTSNNISLADRKLSFILLFTVLINCIFFVFVGDVRRLIGYFFTF
ncbi:proton-translocating NADH-quinone oxidoreductase, chain N family protein [Ehrlichia chaffeensis str. Liberty]|uniref:NADH-quinone oxidoreductase subunit N n=1 Tax=Ehrlichia chaffeensis TaxID=945 RepID=UPI000444DFEB|nr:NADH-quinone oxidoreductase subunit N [Ehrlichia chaffeensis]AHX06623.1 proton-translocating NADH-quinone oxidoreductase, chain N family protein [Ehrlichia chaffeensis str. Liberty]AHX09103.1 proton-translocating NADH-quinone oxidoreductase, chain N family protein [Ehrlichia chaffeensis str. Wakulla]